MLLDIPNMSIPKQNIETVLFFFLSSGTKVELRSEGCRDKGKQGPGCGWAFIRVNGVDRSVHGKGIDFVVLERNGELKCDVT